MTATCAHVVPWLGGSGTSRTVDLGPADNSCVAPIASTTVFPHSGATTTYGAANAATSSAATCTTKGENPVQTPATPRVPTPEPRPTALRVNPHRNTTQSLICPTVLPHRSESQVCTVAHISRKIQWYHQFLLQKLPVTFYVYF